jgi:hypothetical protein
MPDLPFYVIMSVVVAFTLVMCLVRANAKIKKLYSSIHDYQIADPQDFPHIDADFYEIIAANLQLEGFSFLADIEDVTLSSVYPTLRTFGRCLLSSDNITVATIFVINQINGPANVKKIDLTTELSDGRYLVSELGTQGIGMAFPPEIKIQYYDLDTPVEEFIKIHYDKLQLLLAEDNQVKPIIKKTVEDLIDSARRTDKLKTKHREGLGNRITLKELFTIILRGAN